MVHSEIIFLELLRLYYETTGKETLDLRNLEKAFNTFQYLIAERLYISCEYDFDTEFDKLEDLCEELIQFNSDDLLIVDDIMLDLLEDTILSYLNENVDNSFDNMLGDIIYNYSIYKAFDIIPPVENYQSLFNICTTIIRDYQLLAMQESVTGQINSYLIKLISALNKQYLDIYADYSFNYISMLKVVIAYLNEKYLLDDEQDFVNSDWYIVLFGKNKMQKNILLYNRIMKSINEEEEDYNKYNIGKEDEENYEEEINVFEFPSEVTYLDNEIDFFISYYIIMLNYYLKNVTNPTIKENLNIKKYMLIASVPDIENYFLETGSLEDFTFKNFDKKLLTDSSFSSLYLIVIESIEIFNHADWELNNALQEEMIIKAIFIRSFLDLSINEKELENVKNKLVTGRFYKNINYSFATSLIDDIIFKEPDITYVRNKD